jgi:flagellar biosynthesis/type III secretory pathway protein FliH
MAGYADGWQLGDEDGYADGYELGYSDWFRPCSVAGDEKGPEPKSHDEDEADPRDIGECQSRGQRSSKDPGSFARGRLAGITDNPDYQGGYLEQYAIGYDEGALVGQESAYLEGYNLGYSDGLDEAWQIAWIDCYDQSYPDGYGAGYEGGYPDGYEDGADDGDFDSGC